MLWFKANWKKPKKQRESIINYNKRKAKEKHENELYLAFIKEKEILAN